MRLLMREPNVLMLDEPTNDLDIDTLTALEDLLDSWPGTLVIASHDRYFIERVSDSAYALGVAGGLRHLPGGVEQYLSLVDDGDDDGSPSRPPPPAGTAPGTPPGAALAAAPGVPAGATLRAARKEIKRIEAALAKLETQEAWLRAEMASHASDHAQLSDLQAQLDAAGRQREQLETGWLDATDLLERSGQS